jgi:methylmalonyl-CoA mutase
MGSLAQISDACESFDRSVEQQVREVRADPEKGRAVMEKWREIQSRVTYTRTPTGIRLPRLALPELDEPGAVVRYLVGEGLPGEFPYTSAAYREMYLEPARTHTGNGNGHVKQQPVEEPTRLFAGLGLPEDTNARFHFLTKHQKTARLSTAFDGPTLYGLDSDADGVFGKIGEGGVKIDTVEDMERLYAGFDLDKEGSSVSMTINGPAPTILAMFIVAAKRRFGPGVVPKLRGTIQADILKEVQAQNECLFPVDASLRFLADMVEWTTKHMPRWYPISISGYHIGEAGATPVQQAVYTLSNGFAYVELFRNRGMDVDVFGPRLSFFYDCGLDIEYLALSRASRKIWAIGMRDVFKASPRAQVLKLHTQTSGRSLIANEYKNNLTRTAVELMLSLMNASNSIHSNSADEPFTTPGEEYVRLAAHAQAILLEETGLFKHMMNTLPGSPGMKIVEKACQDAILAEFREIDRLGGVLAAVEQRYQRSQIQAAAHRYERQIYSNERPIIGLNRYPSNDAPPELTLARTPRKKQQFQLDRLLKFKKKNRAKAEKALDKLSSVVESGGNTFEALLEAVEVCSLGQITERLHEQVGHYRPTV